MRVKRQKIRRKKIKIGRWILLSVGVFVLFLILFPKKEPEFKGKRTNILAMYKENGRLENLALLCLDEKENTLRISALSSSLETMGKTLKTLYAEREFLGIKEGVEKITNIPIHGYWSFCKDGLQKCVDILGGLKINVSKKMAQKINIPEGERILDGGKVCEFVQVKENPLEDAKTWAIATKALIEKMKEAHPVLLKKALACIKTNLSKKAMKEVQVSIKKVSSSILGEPEVKIRTLDREIEEPIKVRILNGGGIQGLAKRTKERLSFYKGIEVLETKNAEKEYDQTIIFERKEGYGGRIAEILGGGNVQKEGGGEEDVLLILGKDFPELCSIKISVTNGCGIPGLAKRVGEKLSRHNEIKVVDVGNAKSFSHKKTLIIAPKLEDARYIKSLIGYGEVRKGESSKGDVLLLLGEDAAGI